jgi:hypothetical protein
LVWRWEGWQGARITLSLPNGHWWEPDGNPAIQSYFAELYSSDDVEADPDLMQAAPFGTEETPITSVAQLEELLGGPFPAEVRRVL